MAAFSYPHHPVLLDSVLLPNNNSHILIKNNMSGLISDNNIISNNSQFFQSVHGIGIPLESTRSWLDHQSSTIKVADGLDDHDFKDESTTSVTTKKNSTDSSTVVDNYNNKLESGEQVTQKNGIISPMDNRKRRINKYGSSSNSSHPKDVIGRGKKQKNCNDSLVKGKEEKKQIKQNNKKNEDGKKVSEEPPTGYIHVRARRGQATDSHSLAERVRREKISKRMKMLQRLVPGCEKVTGKALMLDEIINYVQSLQNQVEFLSMKLASLNPMFYDFGMDLDAFLVLPEGLNTLVASSQIPCVPQCSQTQPTAANFTADHHNNTTVPAATNFNVTPNINYPLLDNSASLLLQQGHRLSAFSNENGPLMWDVEDHHKQSFLSASGFSNLGSFN